jgi:phage shock protein A
MSLIYRIKRLVKSDLHAFVEGIEDKKWVLAQAIRDMEEELEKLKAGVASRSSHLAKIQEGLRVHQQAIGSIENDIDFAMKEKREEIAKNFIKKLLVGRQTVERLKSEEQHIRTELEHSESDYQSKKRLFEEICARAEGLHLERMGEDVFTSASRLVPEDSSLDHQVELEFLRRLQNGKEVDHV